ACEALCATGRPEAVHKWVERYRRHLSPAPAGREPFGARRVAARARQLPADNALGRLRIT
ncbi:MAG TPA: hypothetical protein VEJ86_07675, partial [Candidatus Binataceae bacterium]|nr:hypothetical protein [Candidatus Binataceae bacterium]